MERGQTEGESVREGVLGETQREMPQGAEAIHDIIENLQAGILVTDADLRVVYANGYETEFYRLPKEELIGRDILTHCHKPRSRQVILTMIDQMKSGELDEKAKFAVGQLIRYKARRGPDGQFAGIVRTRMWLPEGLDTETLEAAVEQESE
ncbi:MAG: hypothetical protein Kow00129_00730 [Thermoleophilia bacterium]